MTTFIFNQYYIDFLKRVKEVSKSKKDDSATAKSFLKTVKEHYVTMDKSSDEYLTFLNSNITDETWEKYTSKECDWLNENKDVNIFKNVSLNDIREIIGDDYLCHHFITVFYIFRKELDEETVSNIINILQSTNSKDDVQKLSNEGIKTVLNNLVDFRNEKIKEKSGIDMKFIEDTTLGKLAKEILEDIDVGKLQKSMGENGDVLKAIGDPDSGFADVIASVSKKMATKISNGDLKQENLLQDAMKFASMMPNMFGGAAGGSSQKKSSGPDMSSMMSMMASMMGSNDDFSKMFQGMAGNKPKAPKGSKTAFNESALKKIAKSKKLKKKLHERRMKAKEGEKQEVDHEETDDATEITTKD